MRWTIHHRTRYTYASPARESYNELHLQPISNEHQSVDSFRLEVQPAAQLRQYHDFYLNSTHHFEIPDAHSILTIDSHVDVTTRWPAGLGLGSRPAQLAQLSDAVKVGRCYDFIQTSRYVDTLPETWRLAVDAIQGETDVWQCALRLMGYVHSQLKYQSSSTQVHTHMRDVLAQRRGVCQDFAHVLLGLCRTLRIPALYVSGYLATETASATHAWTEVYVPGIGWQALDPTHNRQPDESYVKIAVGRDYADVAPVKGAYKGTTQRSMDVEVRIEKK